MIAKQLLLACVAVLVSQSACALESESDRTSAIPVEYSPARFRAQRADIESKLADGKTYAEIKPADKRAVLDAFDRIERAIGSNENAVDLSEEKKRQVFNDQELINVVLTKAHADSRLYCEWIVRTGSRVKQSFCQTVGDRRRNLEASVSTLEQIQRMTPSLAEGQSIGGMGRK